MSSRSLPAGFVAPCLAIPEVASCGPRLKGLTLYRAPPTGALTDCSFADLKRFAVDVA
jgi:hypothetical protein